MLLQIFTLHILILHSYANLVYFLGELNKDSINSFELCRLLNFYPVYMTHVFQHLDTPVFSSTSLNIMALLFASHLFPLLYTDL